MINKHTIIVRPHKWFRSGLVSSEEMELIMDFIIVIEGRQQAMDYEWKEIQQCSFSASDDGLSVLPMGVNSCGTGLWLNIWSCHQWCTVCRFIWSATSLSFKTTSQWIHNSFCDCRSVVHEILILTYNGCSIIVFCALNTLKEFFSL